jgi:uncharacterized hydrophobic protein (TIGR00271 family)
MSDAIHRSHRSRTRLLRVLALLNRWRKLPAAAVDHDAVLAHVAEAGGTSASYLVLIALSCGIAILGLLLSSPAVVIGAMLISPLMNPLVLVGFALATLDLPMAIRGLKAVGLGTALAVLLAAIIVWMSPLNAPTPEILARTTPNFFDLLVAVFSAVAGGYAVAMRKGETIVGVAIATSLMPPLAVVGYGLAVANWAIFLGAAGLFMTNLLAIALTVNLVAHVFGFGAIHPFRTRLWQTLGILATFAVLSIPLGLSLQHIAREAVLTARAKATLTAYFAPRADHVYGVDVRFPANQPVQVTALVLTEKAHRGVEEKLQAQLEQTLRQKVRLSLSQIPVHARESLDQRAVETLIGQSATALTQQLQDPAANIAEIAAAVAGVPLLDVSVDRTEKTVLLRSATSDLARLAVLRQAHDTLAARFPDWRFEFRIASLPPLPFAATQLTPDQTRALGDIAWALKTEGIAKVRVEAGWLRLNERKRALQRAEAVAAVFAENGIDAKAAVALRRTTDRNLTIAASE